MDLTDLHVFRTVAQAGGITRAAERLHRVPSNVTTRLQNLEQDLACPLFVREGKRLVITPAGELLLGYAHRLLDLAQEARDALHDTTPRGRFRIGATESTAATRLPGPLAAFHKRYPQVALELSTTSAPKMLAQLQDGLLDAALVADPVPNPRFESAKAFAEELVLVAHEGHASIRRPADVLPPTLLAFASGCTYRRKLEDWFATGGVHPERVVELSSYHAILGCAVAGMGVALMPRGVLDIFPDRDRLSVHTLPAAVRRSKTVLVWRKGAGSANVRAFAELLLTSGRV